MKRVLTLLFVLALAVPCASYANAATTSAAMQQNAKKQVSGVVTDKSGEAVSEHR